MNEPKNYYGVVAPHATSPTASWLLREAARGVEPTRSFVAEIVTRAKMGDPKARLAADALRHALLVTKRNEITRRYLAMGPKVPHEVLPQAPPPVFQGPSAPAPQLAAMPPMQPGDAQHVAGPCMDHLKAAYSTCKTSLRDQAMQAYAAYQKAAAAWQQEEAARRGAAAPRAATGCACAGGGGGAAGCACGCACSRSATRGEG